MTLFEELKRRKVFRVAGTYAVVAWILMQIGEVTFPALNIPEWVMSTLVVVLLAGFPIAIIFAWIFDKTPEGFIKTKVAVENVDDSREWYARKRTYLTILGILFGFMVGIYGPSYFMDNDLGNKATQEIQKLAILPFSNIRPDNETDFLGYALSDEIINRLGFLKSLIVRPSTAVRQYRGVEVAPDKVGQELDVDLILTGSYLRDRDRLRLNTELMDISRKELVWSKSMTVDYDDIFAIQDSVASSIIDGLKGQISPEDKLSESEVVSNDPRAYELYLKAKAINAIVISDYHRQLTYLNKSKEIDSEFAPVWVAMGVAHHRLGNFGVDQTNNGKMAEICYLKAFDINPTQQQVYGQIIQLYTDLNRLIEAYSYGLKGLLLYPSDKDINAGLGYAVRYAGLLDQAKLFYQKAMLAEFDPYEQILNMNEIARVYFYKGDLMMGREKFDELVNYINSEDIEMPSYIMFYDGMANLYMGENEKAFQIFDLLSKLDSNQIFSKYGQIYKNIILGKKSKALNLINSLQKTTIYDGEQFYRFIQFYALLDMPDKAIEMVKGTLARGFFAYPYYQSDKFIESIRNEPEFIELMKVIKAKHIEFRTLYQTTMNMDLLTDATN